MMAQPLAAVPNPARAGQPMDASMVQAAIMLSDAIAMASGWVGLVADVDY